MMIECAPNPVAACKQAEVPTCYHNTDQALDILNDYITTPSYSHWQGTCTCIHVCLEQTTYSDTPGPDGTAILAKSHTASVTVSVTHVTTAAFQKGARVAAVEPKAYQLDTMYFR
jgi:hypothetical protein